MDMEALFAEMRKAQTGGRDFAAEAAAKREREDADAAAAANASDASDASETFSLPRERREAWSGSRASCQAASLAVSSRVRVIINLSAADNERRDSVPSL